MVDSPAETKYLPSPEPPRRRAGRASTPLASFEGNAHYVRLFNDSVRAFYELDYLPSTRLRTHERLLPSKVTTTTAYYVPKPEPVPGRGRGRPKKAETERTETGCLRQALETPDEFEQLPGVYWTSDEKEIFFNCLARFSIHRCEEFLEYLPRKSLVEIRAYYTLLQGELQRMQQEAAVAVSMKDVETAREIIHEYDIELYPDGPSYSELPIAHEVDDQWLRFEEQQAFLLLERERAITLSRARQDTQMLRQHLDPATQADKLLKHDEFLKLAVLYRANTLVPLAVSRACRLLYASLTFLEQLATLRTRELVGEILLKRGSADAGRGGELEILDLPTAIRRKDVHEAVRDIRLLETPAAGLQSRLREGKIPVRGPYFQQVLASLQLATRAAKMPRYKRQKYYLGTKSWTGLAQVHRDSDMFGLRCVDAAEYSDDMVDCCAAGHYADGEAINSCGAVMVLNSCGIEPDGCGIAEHCRRTKRGYADVLVEEALLHEETATLEELDQQADDLLRAADNELFGAALHTASLIEHCDAAASASVHAVAVDGPTHSACAALREMRMQPLREIRVPGLLWRLLDARSVVSHELLEAWDRSYARYR